MKKLIVRHKDPPPFVDRRKSYTCKGCGKTLGPETRKYRELKAPEDYYDEVCFFKS